MVSPSLPSTPRKVLSGHGMKSSILYLHSPGVRPKVIVRPSGHPLSEEEVGGRALHPCGWLVAPLWYFIRPIFFIYFKNMLREVSGLLELCRIGL